MGAVPGHRAVPQHWPRTAGMPLGCLHGAPPLREHTRVCKGLSKDEMGKFQARSVNQQTGGKEVFHPIGKANKGGGRKEPGCDWESPSQDPSCSEWVWIPGKILIIIN